VANKQGVIRERDAANIVKTLALKSYESGYKVLIIWLAERMNLSAANELLKTLEEPSAGTLLLLVAENRDRMLSTILSRVQTVVVPNTVSGFSAEKKAAFAQMFVSWMRLLFKLNMQTLSAWVDQTHALGREQQKQFLQYSQEAIRACFLKTAAGITLPGELEFGDEKFDNFFPAMVTPRNVEQMNEAMTNAIYAIERNAYAKITFMQLSFTMSKLIKNR
jgi:DNA polymerase-3 subunit delta'